jgi:hypothetical protein
VKQLKTVDVLLFNSHQEYQVRLLYIRLSFIEFQDLVIVGEVSPLSRRVSIQIRIPNTG